MKKLYIYLAACVNLVFIYGCNRDEIIDPSVVVNTSKGAYVLSEGVNANTNRFSFYNRTKDSFYVSIFNPGNIGLYPNGMILDNNSLYITEQGNFGVAGRIYKTDTNGTVISSGNAGVNPYSLTTANNKIYITNGPSNNVSVIDKNSFAPITTVSVGIYPQEILAIGNKVFVCNTSIFGGAYDSTVSVIDASSDQLVATIRVRKTPSALAISADGKLLVGCPGDVSKAAIFKIDPNTYAKLDSFTNLNFGFCKDISVSGANNIYYIGGDIYSEGGIISFNLSTRFSVLTVPTPTGGSKNYGLAYDSEANLLYVGYLTSFEASGKLLVYNLNGVQQKEYTITGGIGPRRIVVKY